MYYTGFADEAALGLDSQIKATKELGWKYIESRNIDGINIHDLPEEKFEEVKETLDREGIKINCFGSSIANWSRDPQSDEDFEKSKQELSRAITRMQKLDCKMVRGMSFTRYRDQTKYTPELEKFIFDKMRVLVKMCEDGGVDYMHENCANYGGMSSDHSLRLVEEMNSPHFKLLFDTGNPTNSVDYRKGHENHMQDAFQFYSAIKEHIGYVHIKDGRFIKLQPEQVFNEAEWTFPGEGEGKVKEIVKDLLDNGYDGGFSMEPHMAIVYHNEASSSAEEIKYKNYVEYGQRFMKLVDEIKG